MAYHIDPIDESLVIDGWEKGVGSSPYDGLANMRNVNIITTPGEACVNYATTLRSFASVPNITITSSSSVNDTVTANGGTYQPGSTITFSASTIGGVSTNTPYWLGNVSGTTFSLFSDPYLLSIVDITGASGTGTAATIDIGKPLYSTYSANSGSSYWILDANGRVWSDQPQGAIQDVLRYMGNTTLTNASGNGIVAYRGYIFVFRNSLIDYYKISTKAWVYGWDPSAGTGGATGTFLNNGQGADNPHFALVGQDDTVYYTDAAFVGSFRQAAGTTFDPATSTTVVWAKQALALPSFETANCLAELGVNLLVGGSFNAIYPWDRVSTSFTYPILLAENNIKRLVTVNTNTYIFVGQRGRIFITNGSQANLYKKLPDNIFGSPDPYYTWGDANFDKNQLYFSAKARTNSGTLGGVYQGLWAIDLETDAMRQTLSMTQQQSYATLIQPIYITANAIPTGSGLYIGWWETGNNLYGVDLTGSAPYTDGTSLIESDLIPIGTFDRPKDFTRIEHKLSYPLVAGESIEIQYRLINAGATAGYASIYTDSTAGSFSKSNTLNFKNAQWVQFMIILTSTASSPSYVRLKEIRIR